VESLTFESLIHDSKQLIQDLTLLHESDSKSFRREFMPYYWASEFVATAEEYASKFEVGSCLEGPLICDIQECLERSKLMWLLDHQFCGFGFVLETLFGQVCEEPMDTAVYALDFENKIKRLQEMIYTIYGKAAQDFDRVKFTEEFEIGTSWIGKLLCFHALVIWVL